MVEFGYRSIQLRYPEISHPATQVLGQLEHSILHGDTPAPSGQFLDALFETHKSLVRPTDFGTRKGKTEEGDLVGMSHLAFLLVDFEFESLFKKPGDTGHDPLTRPATLHQNDEVIGIAGEAVAAPFQLLVKLIQEDVAEQW